MWVIYGKENFDIFGEYVSIDRAYSDYQLLIRGVSNDQYERVFSSFAVENMGTMDREEWRMWKMLGGKAA